MRIESPRPPGSLFLDLADASPFPPRTEASVGSLHPQLYSPNKDFWASRKDHPNPRSVFFSSPDEISSASAAVDKVKAAAVIKAKEATMAGHEEEKRASEASGMH